MTAAQYGLTPRQRDCLDAIVNHQTAHGSAPSYEELCAALALKSRGGVMRYLDALEERGYIQRRPNTKRSISVIAGRDVRPRPQYELPAEVDANLRRFCAANGETDPAAVIADAVTLYIDQAEHDRRVEAAR
ncbi:transcriptional repressor, LexA family [Rhodopseudomonas palustris TIE-1]|uniref:LexA family protein n=1 Tax=Rhodopseudomonas palustris TaxID=1076 RepID=UPI000164A9AA|nr:MarR family transcriptional regulator [Rhodopseudomonas palustris]ACF01875.1 transcriptional repressor, LexA family [Rhodopseudomonas palustris TIE-1]